MAFQHLVSRLRAWERRSPNMILKVLRGCALALMLIPAFGGWMLIVFLSPKRNEGRSHRSANHANEDITYATQQAEGPLRRRFVGSFRQWVKKLCRPSSYLPILSIAFALLYGVRAMEDHQLSFPGTQDYQTSCPLDSRRTPTAVFVKLFAASVTTVGVHGHLSSLNGSKSWRLELFRVLQLGVNPLASVFAFVDLAWYNFIDLFVPSLGLWKCGIRVRHRFASLCGCHVQTRVTPDNGLRYPIGQVGPHHLEAKPLERDLRWGGRLLVLVVMLGQYVQAAVLITRRMLSNTAAGVDYAMMFLVMSALPSLFRSLTISVLNVSWTVNREIEPCTEALCHLPGCAAFKDNQGLPCRTIRIMMFGHNIASYPRMVLYQLVGGFLQCSILLRLQSSVWSNIMMLGVSQYAWQSTIMYAFYVGGFWELASEGSRIDSTHSAEELPENQTTGTLPSHVEPHSPDGTSQGFTIADAVTALFLSVVGVAAIAWLCLLLVWQLLWLIMPCIAMYSRIAAETESWMRADPTQPCPQLWKDGLEDELWWF
ncbi:hypothetical protein OPT61_g2424 [Boeremia exigua]|uniref:Uncharacterized protein n=1 Tax=Boeremia exigua TaxID=749465 RepID=A0ACC2ILS7_9PLEO|nr:hypothetical protein OPT61_g2424 [Boeremia exigua]